ncbi:MAG: ComF family protein [Firmicutes bacterium]|nr:ComF family protein [Bacillota bacterium]
MEGVWKMIGKKALEKACSLIYPADIYCLSCGKAIDPGHVYSLCEDCLNEIVWADRRNCRICGKPLESWYPAELCSECLVMPRSFERGVTCFLYREGGRRMIMDLKYHGKQYIARVLGRILADRILFEGLDFDLCVHVPMYKKKEQERGYDQAELIARFTAKNLEKSFYPGILVRTRATAPMNSLTAVERKRNLRDAFTVREEARERIQGRSVLLIDDIYTTGATMNECASELKKAGAAHVWIASIASGRNQRELAEERDFAESSAGRSADSVSERIRDFADDR